MRGKIRRKRMFAFLLSLCMILSPMGSYTVDAETLNDDVISLATVSGGDSVSDNDTWAISEDFEGEEIGAWDMTGTLVDNNWVSVAELDGNKYLNVNTKDRKGNWDATKTLEDVPAVMTNATVSFDWYTGTVTSGNRAGYFGLQFLDNGTEVLSLYANDMRSAEKYPTSALYYSANGYDAKVASEATVQFNTWYDVDVTFDFEAHTATIKLDGEDVAAVEISETIQKVNQFAMASLEPTGVEKVSFVGGGVDNFKMNYNKFKLSTDFEAEDIGVWDMTGTLVDNNWVSVGELDGNKYLNVNTKDRKGNWDATKTFTDAPNVMENATVSFDWYTGTVTSGNRAGYFGLQFLDNGTEVLSLYANDMRSAEKYPTSALYYSAKGYDAKVASEATVRFNTWYDVDVTFDFEAHTATIKLDGEEAAAVEISETVQKVNQFAMASLEPTGVEKVSFAGCGIDNFVLSGVEITEVDETAIGAIAAIDTKTVTKAEWEAGTAHPTSVTATLLDGETTIEAPIKADAWTSVPEFDPEVKGWYTWTGELEAIEGHANNLGFQPTYVMKYVGEYVQTKYYENDFTFDIWSSVAWSKSMDKDSGTGTAPLAHVQDANGNYYMKFGGSQQNAERGNRLDLSSENYVAGTVEFDIMPINCAEDSNGEILFVGPNESWNSYFTVRVDSTNTISLYTKCSLSNTTTVQEAFEGSVSEGDAINTGLGAANEWYTVKLNFDYANHTVDVEVFEKANEANKFTVTDLPIDKSVQGLQYMTLKMDRAGSTGKPNVGFGIDNLAIDYTAIQANDIVAVAQPEDVMVAREDFDSFPWPAEVEVTLGDGSTTTLQLGEWTSKPAMDFETEGTYAWTAPLVVPEELNNVYNLSANFDMIYTLLPYPLYAHNPEPLELEMGEAFDGKFPETVQAFMSDGSIYDMPVSEWTAIREFNADEEGIYVYGADLVAEENKTKIFEDRLSKNENHDKYGSDKDAYVYDVYFRINYFETEDNLYAYERSMEYLDRGVYAIKTAEGVFVSWRLLATEYGQNVAFDVYRNGVRVNESPITDKTNYVDVNGNAGDTYTVIMTLGENKTQSAAVIANDKDYMSIPLQKPADMPDKGGTLASYSINDTGVADVDGDGQFEIIVKWYPSDGFDSGKAVEGGYSSPTIFDVYEMDGTPLWRLNMGLEMPSGAHFNQFMFYDLDEDGKAELFLKTSDGTVSYKPNADGVFDMNDESTIVSYIGDKSVVPGSGIGSNGHATNASNEYVTVFNGLTGEEIDTIDFVNTTGEYADWGKSDGGNRSARYNTAIAYLPEAEGSTDTIPAVLFNRGYYDKTTVAAYTLRDGELNLEWNFVALGGTTNAGKGNHNMVAGDLDNDGFDELVIGAMAIDHDGSVLWVKDGEEGRDFSGHADSIHVSAMLPDSDQLYVMTPSEEKESFLNYSVTNTATGGRLAGIFMAKADIGRGVAANITPTPGFEFWANVPNSEIGNTAPTGAIYNVTGEIISQTKPVGFSTNWTLYWDGDLLSELGDGATTSLGDGPFAVFEYDWENNEMDTVKVFEGTLSNNGTKNNPGLTADLFGDWREEVVLRSEDNTELRVYMTTEETDYMIYTLMHDPLYRNSVANQNTSYNQPNHLSFYLGEDNADEVLAMQLPTYNISYTVSAGDVEEAPLVDKTDLYKAVTNAESLNEADYTAASWEPVKTALEAAKAVLEMDGAQESDVAAALANLNNAVAGLVKAPVPTTTPTPTTTPEPTATPTPVTQEVQKGVTYKVSGSGVTISKIDKNATSVTIPTTITTSDGQVHKVTSIANNAAKGNTKLTKVVIGSNITSIGDYAFYGCKNLKSVSIGKNVTKIGKCAFAKNTSLTTITIPDKVKTVGTNTFDGCTKLKTVKLGKSLTAISDKMFYKCSSLTKVTIPSKVTKIGKSAFASCTKLSSVTIGKKVSSIGSSAFYKCTSLKKVTIPSSVKTIGGSAFSGCTKLATLTIGSKVTTIDKNAFYKCSALKKVTIPASVKTIGANAFNGCKSLKSITIKTTKLTTKTVGNKAFSGINAKATIKVPGKKLADYKTLLLKKGVKKTATIKK